MRHWLARLAAMGAVVFLLLPGTPASAQAGDTKFHAWLSGSPYTSFDPDSGWCYIDVAFGMQEFAKHGIQGFKWRMRAYGVDQPVARDFLSSVIATWGWYYSTPFPNDEQSFYWKKDLHDVGLRVVLATGQARHAYLLIKTVGIRPSWWQRDIVRWLDVGECSIYEVNTSM